MSFDQFMGVWFMVLLSIFVVTLARGIWRALKK